MLRRGVRGRDPGPNRTSRCFQDARSVEPNTLSKFGPGLIRRRAGAIACATTGDAPFAFALAWALLAIGVELSASKPAAAFDGTAVAALRGTALAGAGVLVWLAVAAVAFEYVVEPWHS